MGAHIVPSPYPMSSVNADGVGPLVLDEQCTCGCLRSQHFDLLCVEFGGGGCGTIECTCTKFTWAKFIY